jgi:hypothetical protein
MKPERSAPSFLFRGKFFVGIFLAAFAAVAWAASLDGSLSGNVTQDDNHATYPVEMELNGLTGSVNYPSLQCGGKLEFLRMTGATYWYRENITFGKDHCYDGGMIGISPADARSLDAWNWRWEGFGVTVQGLVKGHVTINR